MTTRVSIGADGIRFIVGTADTGPAGGIFVFAERRTVRGPCHREPVPELQRETKARGVRVLRVRVRAVRRLLPVRVRFPVTVDLDTAGGQRGHAAVVPAGRWPAEILDRGGPPVLAHCRRPGRVPHGGQRGRGRRPTRMDTPLRLPGLRIAAAYASPLRSTQRYHVRHLRAHHGHDRPIPLAPGQTGNECIIILLCCSSRYDIQLGSKPKNTNNCKFFYII